MILIKLAVSSSSRKLSESQIWIFKTFERYNGDNEGVVEVGRSYWEEPF